MEKKKKDKKENALKKKKSNGDVDLKVGGTFCSVKID